MPHDSGAPGPVAGRGAAAAAAAVPGAGPADPPAASTTTPLRRVDAPAAAGPGGGETAGGAFGRAARPAELARVGPAVGPDGLALVLADVAATVGSSLELRDVLDVVARRTRALLDADRVSVLLLDEDDRLCPATAVAREDDPTLWDRFRDLEPLDESAVPLLRLVLDRRRAVAVDDVATSPLLPEDIKRTFGQVSLAVAPFVAGRRVCGVLVVDHVVRPHVFADDELWALEAVAAAGATAVRNAAAYAHAVKQASGLDRMLAVTAALNAAATPHQVLQSAMDGMLAVLGGESCSVNVLDGDAVRTLASRGPGQPEPGVHPLCEVDAEERARIRDAWATRPHEPLVYQGAPRALLLGGPPADPRAAGSVVLVPFVEQDVVRGFLLVGRADPGRPDRQQVALAVSVAGQIWLALERARLSESLAHRLRHMEVLHRLADEAPFAPDMGVVVERLAPSVREATGAELIDVVLCDARAARLFRSPAAPGGLSGVLRGWRRRPGDGPVEVSGLLVVPMRLDDELVGVLRVRPVGAAALGPDETAFLLVVAGGLASVVMRAVLRAEVADHERQLAVAAERERIARDLHDTLGQMLFAIGLEIGECAGQAGDELRRRLTAVQASVSTANAEVRQAIHALSFLDRNGHGLVRSLRDLVRQTARTAPFQIELKVTGTARPLPPGREEALYRIAHEALTNVEKHARASTVVMRLAYRDDGVELDVRDDGVGMALRQGTPPGLHFGLRTMRRRVGEVGGRFELRNCRPHGVRITAWVPAT